MAKSLKTYALKHLVFILLAIIAVWAALFYAVILDEVYDNVDDGLKNQKISIIREAYLDSTLLQTREFGINQYRILPVDTLDKSNRFSKEMIYMEYDGELEPYRVLQTGFYAFNGQPYSLEIRTSTVEEDDFRLNLSVALLVLYVLILLTIYIVNSLVLKKALKPLNTIIQSLREYRFGSQNHFIPTESPVTEFIILNEKLEEMISRNEEIFSHQKTFVENASHELQTPLAIAINKLDLLLEDPKLNELQLTAISEAKQSLHRMTQLNKSLLMLSKIDHGQFAQTETLSFNQVFEDLYEEVKDILKFKQLTLDYKKQGEFIFEANLHLIRALLSNLLQNAIRHNKPKGKIEVVITRKDFTMANTGTSTALSPTTIFKRFYKQSDDKNSSGLGLAIVEGIVRTYPSLSISYSFREGLHLFKIEQENQ